MVAVMKSVGLPTQSDFHEAISLRADRWYAACLKITRDRSLAEDAVQDALLNAWNKRHQFEQSARLDTWIHRIAVNAALQILRKNRPNATLAVVVFTAACLRRPKPVRLPLSTPWRWRCSFTGGSTYGTSTE